jgi:hypothetical protein
MDSDSFPSSSHTVCMWGGGRLEEKDEEGFGHSP